MKKVLKYIFTTNPLNVIKDWFDYAALKDDVARAKREMDFHYELIKDEKITNFSRGYSKIVIDDSMYNTLFTGCLSNQSGLLYRHKACLCKLYQCDDKKRKSTDGMNFGGITYCVNFDTDKPCADKKCWRHAMNNLYIFKHQEYERLNTMRATYWENKFKRTK